MYKKIVSVITVVLFLGSLLLLLVCNFKAFSSGVGSIFEPADSDSAKASDQIENYVKSEFPLKSAAREGYGLGLLALNKDIVGNGEYTKLSDGSVVLTNPIENVDIFTDSMLKLSSILLEKNIPLVYVQTPYKPMTDGENAVSGNDVFVSLMNGMCETFRQNGIDVFDLNENERIHNMGNVYFRTDVHATTEFEFASADIILSYLGDSYGLSFPSIGNVFDINNYNVISYPFYGNTTLNTGHFYSPEDTFNIYHPLYDTDMRLYDYSDGTEKEGPYDNVCLNGYENGTYNDRTYWVTDYLRWPSPCYEIVNRKEEQASNLLVICDSIYLRGCSFLSLASNSVTVYDPRFDGGYYLDVAFKYHEYNAVVVIGSSFYYVPINTSYLESELSAEVLSYSLTGDRMEVSVLNNSNTAWSNSDSIRCCLWMNNEDWGIRAYIPDGTEVAPGETVTLTFENVSASVEIADTVEIQMLQEGVLYFGDRYKVKP